MMIIRHSRKANAFPKGEIWNIAYSYVRKLFKTKRSLDEHTFIPNFLYLLYQQIQGAALSKNLSCHSLASIWDKQTLSPISSSINKGDLEFFLLKKVNSELKNPLSLLCSFCFNKPKGLIVFSLSLFLPKELLLLLESKVSLEDEAINVSAK